MDACSCIGLAVRVQSMLLGGLECAQAHQYEPFWHFEERALLLKAEDVAGQGPAVLTIAKCRDWLGVRLLLCQHFC